tara:strand:- start:4 stop:273 length:270 start_codon:yes stop_codon:yes gene_type:complete
LGRRYIKRSFGFLGSGHNNIGSREISVLLFFVTRCRFDDDELDEEDDDDDEEEEEELEDDDDELEDDEDDDDDDEDLFREGNFFLPTLT